MQESFTVRSRPRAFEDITERVGSLVQASGIQTGLCNVFLRHTSAALLICENADPAVRRDLEHFMQRMAPDSGEYDHDTEGPDDMPAHIRCMLIGVSVTIPVRAARLGLGTWQGIYLWEQRTAAHEREVIVTLLRA